MLRDLWKVFWFTSYFLQQTISKSLFFGDLQLRQVDANMSEAGSKQVESKKEEKAAAEEERAHKKQEIKDGATVRPVGRVVGVGLGRP